MKIRNKKTGEIVTLDSDHNDSLADFGGKLLLETRTGKEYSYNTLARFNEDWEDYKPAEPLIKDEKIRKAVRAWAEANGVGKVTVEKDFSSYTFFPTDTSKVDITVWTEPSLSNLSKDCETYTITELCGEEE